MTERAIKHCIPVRGRTGRWAKNRLAVKPSSEMVHIMTTVTDSDLLARAIACCQQTSRRRGHVHTRRP